MTDSINTPDESLEDNAQEPKTFDAEYVSKLRAEAADYRTKAKASAEAAEAAQKVADENAQRLAELESNLTKAQADVLRLQIANKHGISEEDASLFLTGTDEETLTKQAERLASKESGKKPFGSYVPSEGKNPTPGDGNELREVARQIFHRN